MTGEEAGSLSSSFARSTITLLVTIGLVVAGGASHAARRAKPRIVQVEYSASDPNLSVQWVAGVMCGSKCIEVFATDRERKVAISVIDDHSPNVFIRAFQDFDGDTFPDEMHEFCASGDRPLEIATKPSTRISLFVETTAATYQGANSEWVCPGVPTAGVVSFEFR